MNDIFGWLIKLLFIVMLLPCFLGLAGSLVSAALMVLLPWVIGLCVLIGLVGGIAAGLVARRRLPLPPRQFPSGEVTRIRRPRGVRTER